MTVVGLPLHQLIVARIRDWRNLTGDDIWYEFDYTIPAATVPFGFSFTVNTGYVNTG